MVSIVLFQKEIFKFQIDYLKEIMSKIDHKNLMTTNLMDFFEQEMLELNISVKEDIKKCKKSMKTKKSSSEKKDKTPRQVLLTENMKYVRNKYQDTGVVQTNVMTCGQYMTTKMTNDSNLSTYDALIESIKMVNEKKGEIIFEEIEKSDTECDTKEIVPEIVEIVPETVPENVEIVPDNEGNVEVVVETVVEIVENLENVPENKVSKKKKTKSSK